MLVDLIVHNASQLVTCSSPHGPKRGAAMTDAGIIEDGAIAIKDGHIVAVGPTREVRIEYAARHLLDATGRVVCPGFIDPHTHVVYAGDRTGEFERRIQGATYMEILKAGGGILNTVQATRQASEAELIAEARVRLDIMLKSGTTTVEVKTGYGLDTETELKMLRVIGELDRTHVANLVPTFLGAHAVPPESRVDDYVTLVEQEMIPAAQKWYESSRFAAGGVPMFVDVFCEDGVFDVNQSRRVLGAAFRRGLPIKAHVDEFVSLGGVAMALQLQAASVDHLDVTGADDIARIATSDAVAVPLPAVNFHLGTAQYADARALIDGGAALALATDLNPGSAPCYSMPLVMAIACRYQQMLPSEALNAATINAAYAVGLGDRLGSLEAGKQGDVLVLDIADYRHLVYYLGWNPVAHVIKRGEIVHSA
jgi:imidazolonepropionase